ATASAGSLRNMAAKATAFEYFCGEVVFLHELPFDRSSLTRWRQRLGEEQIVALLQGSLSVAHRTGAIDTKDLERVAIDTTVQEKAIAHPTDARLTHRAIEKLVELANREGVELRQSYLRLAKRAAIMVGRYTHAHQFKRARRELIKRFSFSRSSIIEPRPGSSLRLQTRQGNIVAFGRFAKPPVGARTSSAFRRSLALTDSLSPRDLALDRLPHERHAVLALVEDGRDSFERARGELYGR